MLFERVLDLVIRLAHFDKGLGIVAAGNDTAVVVAQHHDRHLGQVGTKHPLATGIEAVAVDQREDGVVLRHGCAQCW
ncbi:hypothetical protein D3C72_2159690 [compost metagenome]